MNARSFLLHDAAGGLLLLGVAGTAMADDQQGTDDVDAGDYSSTLTLSLVE